MKYFAAIISLSFLAILISPAFAHDLTLAYTTLNISAPNAYIEMQFPEQNLNLLYPNLTIDESLAIFPDYMKSKLLIWSEAGNCTPDIRTEKEAETVKASGLYRCGRMEFMNMSYHMFAEISSTHENILDIYLDDANISGRIILSEEGIYNVNIPAGELVRSYRSKNNASPASPADGPDPSNITGLGLEQENTAASFFLLGVEHIFTGYDHILFIIGILLITTFFLQLTKIVTSFTIAHSITLIIATLGFAALSPRLTEPLIALTIAYIAAENIYVLRGEKKRAKRKAKERSFFRKYIARPDKRWRITFLLGLIHGFGFSSVLRDIGLPEKDLIPALLSFNLGVEAGQLAIVAVLFPLLIYSRRFRWHNRAVLSLSIIIGIVGAFWFLQRVFGF